MVPAKPSLATWRAMRLTLLGCSLKMRATFTRVASLAFTIWAVASRREARAVVGGPLEQLRGPQEQRPAVILSVMQQAQPITEQHAGGMGSSGWGFADSASAASR